MLCRPGRRRPRPLLWVWRPWLGSKKERIPRSGGGKEGGVLDVSIFEANVMSGISVDQERKIFHVDFSIADTGVEDQRQTLRRIFRWAKITHEDKSSLEQAGFTRGGVDPFVLPKIPGCRCLKGMFFSWNACNWDTFLANTT